MLSSPKSSEKNEEVERERPPVTSGDEKEPAAGSSDMVSEAEKKRKEEFERKKLEMNKRLAVMKTETGALGGTANKRRMTVSNHHALKSGFLVKCGGIHKNWKKRWFVLKPNLLVST